MLFRRMIEHVKAQNWTAVVLDFVIVVVGVFVGLQAQRWAEQRAESRDEGHILHRLHAEIEMHKRLAILGATYLVFLASLGRVDAAEFEASDIIPEVSSVVFTQESIALTIAWLEIHGRKTSGWYRETGFP